MAGPGGGGTGGGGTGGGGTGGGGTGGGGTGGTHTPAPGRPHTASDTLSGFAHGHPTLRFTLTSGKNAPKLTAVTLVVPRGLGVVRGRKHHPGTTVSVTGAKIKSVVFSHGRIIITLRQGQRPLDPHRASAHRHAKAGAGGGAPQDQAPDAGADHPGREGRTHAAGSGVRRA